MKRLNFFLLLGTFASLASCSVLTSERYLAQYRGGGPGIPYFLPAGKIHLQVVEHSTQEVAVAQSPAPASSSTATPPPAESDPATPGNFNRLPLPQMEATKKISKVNAIKFLGTSYSADPDLQFVLNYRAAATAEDDVKVTVGADGLLSKITVTSEDKTGAILLKLVEIGKEAAKIGTIFAEGGETVVYDATFDPFDDKMRHRVINDLERFGCSYQLVRKSGSASIGKNIAVADEPQSRASGVAFRPVFAYDLILRQNDRDISIQTVLLPNEAQVMTIPITRAAFVKKITTVGFNQGLLAQLEINKPSEALGFVEIPLAIAKAIVALPGELIKLKIDTTKGKTDLLTQQKQQIEAEQLLQKLRDQVRTAQTGAGTAADAAATQP
jgi:hypothetical protein